MKKVFKLFLVAALTLCTTSIFAQKLGRINSQEVIVAMPETAQMQVDMETFRKDLADQLETMNVELNNMFADYQKNGATMTASVKSLKEKEMQDLQTRAQQFEQNAMQEMQNKQNELLQPIVKKAQEAIAKVAKAGAYTAIFDMTSQSLAYVDEASVTDITAEVKTSLGIK